MKRNTYAPPKALAILCGLILAYFGLGFPLPLPMIVEPNVMMIALTPEGGSRTFQSTRFQIRGVVKITLTERVIVNHREPKVSVVRYIQLSYS